MVVPSWPPTTTSSEILNIKKQSESSCFPRAHRGSRDKCMPVDEEMHDYSKSPLERGTIVGL